MTNRRPPAPQPPQPSLPQGYLKNGYFDKDGYITEEVITNWPQQLAGAFFRARPQLKTNQLRNFFQYVRRQEARLNSGAPFASLKEGILRLDSYGENARKRGNAPALFRNFIAQNVRLAAKDEKAFKAFVTHFECIVGYYAETR